jgi:hypothetical protein
MFYEEDYNELSIEQMRYEAQARNARRYEKEKDRLPHIDGPLPKDENGLIQMGELLEI